MRTGLDPELLVMSNDKVVPASYFLDPPERDSEGRLNTLSFDNAAVEMRPRESHDPREVVARLGGLIDKAAARLRGAQQVAKIPLGSHLTIAPSGWLPQTESDIASVRQFGCSPSCTLTASYSTITTRPKKSATTTTARSAGFHIHQELPNPDTAECVVAVLDGLLGLLDVIANGKFDWLKQLNTRREYLGYGRAGEYRLRHINDIPVLEYRVLSPWPIITPKTSLGIINVVREVASKDIDTLLSVLEIYPKREFIIKAINDCNPDLSLLLYQACTTAWWDVIQDEHAIFNFDALVSTGRAVSPVIDGTAWFHHLTARNR